MIRAIFIVILFYIFALLQTGFLAHFVLFGLAPSLFGITPSLILVSVILINIFAKDYKFSFFAAFVGGLFLDIFSLGQSFFGFQTLIFLISAFFIRVLMQKYVQLPSSRRF